MFYKKKKQVGRKIQGTLKKGEGRKAGVGGRRRAAGAADLFAVKGDRRSQEPQCCVGPNTT